MLALSLGNSQNWLTSAETLCRRLGVPRIVPDCACSLCMRPCNAMQGGRHVLSATLLINQEPAYGTPECFRVGDARGRRSQKTCVRSRHAVIEYLAMCVSRMRTARKFTMISLIACITSQHHLAVAKGSASRSHMRTYARSRQSGFGSRHTPRMRLHKF